MNEKRRRGFWGTLGCLVRRRTWTTTHSAKCSFEWTSPLLGSGGRDHGIAIIERCNETGEERAWLCTMTERRKLDLDFAKGFIPSNKALTSADEGGVS